MRRGVYLGAMVAVAFLVGCANPGIVPMSENTFMLAKTDRAGIFGNASALKAEVIQEANAFASSRGKVAVPIAAHETPMAPGRFASFEYQFKLVDPTDPGAKGGALLPRPDTVIQNTGTTKIELLDKGASKADTYTELLKLDDLRNRGVITQDEFEQMKRKLLSK